MTEEKRKYEIRCPVCDKTGWYYDPFPKVWKCPHCEYKDNSLFGKIFCFECGEFIRNPLEVRAKGEMFFHPKCYEIWLQKPKI